MKQRVLALRIEQDAYDMLVRLAKISGYKTVSAYARAALKATTPIVRNEQKLPTVAVLDRRVYAHLLTELRIQGRNLNQATAALQEIANLIKFVASRDRWDPQTSFFIDASLRPVPDLLKESHEIAREQTALMKELAERAQAMIDEPLAKDGHSA